MTTDEVEAAFKRLPDQDFAKVIVNEVNRVVGESLNDPDIRVMGKQFRLGYEKGLREGLLMMAASRMKG